MATLRGCFGGGAGGCVFRESGDGRALRPLLETGPARGWIKVGCDATAISANPALASGDCSDYYAGWFVWAFRQAVAEAGHWDSESHNQAFLARIASEINDACATGQLACGPPRASLDDPFRLENVLEMIALLPAALNVLTSSGSFNQSTSIGDPVFRAPPAELVGSPIAAREPHSHVAEVVGWVASPTGVPSVSVSTTPNGKIHRRPFRSSCKWTTLSRHYWLAGKPVGRPSIFRDGNRLCSARLPAHGRGRRRSRGQTSDQ